MTIHFIDSRKIRSWENDDITGKMMLPGGHLNTILNCASCHTIVTGYDIVYVDHDFVIGACVDCHTSPTTPP